MCLNGKIKATCDFLFWDFRGLAMKGEFAPIYIVMGMVAAALTIATHTAKQQLLHSPTVHVSKKKRETMPEVDDPDGVINCASNFVNKSFLRKVAHIQDTDPKPKLSTRYVQVYLTFHDLDKQLKNNNASRRFKIFMRPIYFLLNMSLENLQ